MSDELGSGPVPIPPSEGTLPSAPDIDDQEALEALSRQLRTFMLNNALMWAGEIGAERPLPRATVLIGPGYFFAGRIDPHENDSLSIDGQSIYFGSFNDYTPSDKLDGLEGMLGMFLYDRRGMHMDSFTVFVADYDYWERLKGKPLRESRTDDYAELTYLVKPAGFEEAIEVKVVVIDLLFRQRKHELGDGLSVTTFPKDETDQ